MSIQITGALRPQDRNFDLSPAKDLNPTTSSRIADAALRAAALICGAGILSASTWAATEAGKLTGPDAALVAAMAGGVAIGSILLSRVRGTMAAVIVIALMSGEAYGLLSTAERIVSRRDGAASVTIGDNQTNQAAKDRLAKAEAAKVDHDNKAIKTVATADCRKECKALLHEQAERLSEEVKEARRAVGAAPVMKSAHALADRVGVSPVTLDLLAAVLLSVGSNLLGSVLLAWGARSSTGGTLHEPVAANHARSAVVNLQTPATAVVPELVQVPALVDGTHQSDNGDEHDPRPPRGGLHVPVSQRNKGLMALIAASDGHLAGSQRQIAERSGLSKSALNRALNELATAGVVDVSTCRVAGTRVRLRAA